MAIKFSNLKRALHGHDLVGFKLGTEAGDAKLSTSKRGDKGPSRERALSKSSTSKMGGDKRPR